jgi:hypothetical protein
MANSGKTGGEADGVGGLTETSRNSRPSLRRSLIDPVVIAAIVGVIGAVLGALATSFDRSDAKCDRAFAFLQDESVNPKLENDDAFYQMQRRIAENCSRSTNR